MITAAADPRFAVQQVGHEEWLRATLANVVADHLAGFSAITDLFLATRSEPEFAALGEWLREASPPEIAESVAATRDHSLVFLVLMLTGGCNADCTICFTDRKRKAGELAAEERDRVLRQARQLGARFVYVPGEGEPTIDRGFWSFLATCRELGLEAVVFTNGVLLSDAASCRKVWGCDPDTAVARLAEYPVSLYHKLWSTRPALVAEMMQIPPRLLPYATYQGTAVPAGLVRLLEGFPRERVGIEVVVERRNAEEVVETIVPFAESHGLARIVEMIQHNGRVFGDGRFDPTPAQAAPALRHLSPTSCSMATCKAVVTSRGYLSPRIAVLEHQIPGDPVDVRRGELFDLLHRTAYVAQRRYDVYTCLCEKLPLEMACCKNGSSVQLPSPNVTPHGLASRAIAAAGREEVARG